jgi:hypothetical protein
LNDCPECRPLSARLSRVFSPASEGRKRFSLADRQPPSGRSLKLILSNAQKRPENTGKTEKKLNLQGDFNNSELSVINKLH